MKKLKLEEILVTEVKLNRVKPNSRFYAYYINCPNCKRTLVIKKESKILNKVSDIEGKAIDTVVEYLKSIGWDCLVGGFDSIEQGNGTYNFRLVFKFTGKKLTLEK